MEPQPMADVTQILQAVETGDKLAADELLSLVYGELKKLAAVRLAAESSNSIVATELVHEAYLRLFGTTQPNFENRRHFFGAASEAMRRVMVDRARKRLSEKRGGKIAHVELEPDLVEAPIVDEKLVSLQDALCKLEKLDENKAKLVKLRFFAGLPIRQVAELLGISTATADRQWRFVRAWLQNEMNQQ